MNVSLLPINQNITSVYFTNFEKTPAFVSVPNIKEDLKSGYKQKALFVLVNIVLLHLVKFTGTSQ